MIFFHEFSLFINNIQKNYELFQKEKNISIDLIKDIQSNIINNIKKIDLNNNDIKYCLIFISDSLFIKNNLWEENSLERLFFSTTCSASIICQKIERLYQNNSTINIELLGIYLYILSYSKYNLPLVDKQKIYKYLQECFIKKNRQLLNLKKIIIKKSDQLNFIFNIFHVFFILFIIFFFDILFSTYLSSLLII